MGSLREPRPPNPFSGGLACLRTPGSLREPRPPNPFSGGLACLRTPGSLREPRPPNPFAGLEVPRNPDTLALLHTHWLGCARYEHASIAAFARVGLQLLSLGAPAELLRATHLAMRDEVQHARLCFGLAAAYGAGFEAGPLPIAGSVATGMDLETLLREAIFDGALGEGAAARRAHEGARTCEDSVVAEVLSRIAVDEQRHALLAYQTVQWALLAYPERAPSIVMECLREGDRQRAQAPLELGSNFGSRLEGDPSNRHGLLSTHQRAQIRDDTWTHVVAPILASMLCAPHLQQAPPTGS